MAEGRLALLRHAQSLPATYPNTALPILHLSHPIARWDVLVVYRCIFVTPYCATPSPTPLHTLASHPGPPTPTQKKDTHIGSLPRLTFPSPFPHPAQSKHNGPGQPGCGAPSHHTPTCQKSPLSQDFISVLTYPCPGPQAETCTVVPRPALDVRPAPARDVPPCPSEPLLEFFSQE